MKKIILCGTVLLLAACQNISQKDFQLSDFQSEKLPPLEAVVDVNNLESVFSAGGYYGTSYNNGTLYNDNSSWVQTTSISGDYIKDSRIQNTVTLFNDFVKDKITSPYGAKKGSMRLTVDYRNHQKNYTNILTGLATFFSIYTLPLVGFPVKSYEDEMKLSVEIYNNRKEMIRRYSAVVDNKTWVALYWGYNVNDVADKASLDNVRQALNQIGMQISAEAPQIKKLLN